jgi:uncharacterized repeat protein (TIGR03803 family)
VYEILRPVPPKTAWTQVTLYSFTGGIDGGSPFAGLVFDKSGNLYGTTIGGGAGRHGTVFELKRPVIAGGDWTETVLYSFQGTGDGSQPYGAVIFDGSGNLYGTTFLQSTIFELIPPASGGGDWTESVLYRFALEYAPMSAPILDAAGNLYGTASKGGHNGVGALWRLTRPPSPGGTWIYKSLYVFGGGTQHYDPTDGAVPYDSPVLVKGAFYGTTDSGGQYGFGTVFRLAPPTVAGGAWTETVLYSFSGGSAGACPTANVTFDPAGNIYGTTSGLAGIIGQDGLCTGNLGYGTVFKLTPPVSSDDPWTETTLHSFGNGKDGSLPTGGLILGKSGAFLGVTLLGGAANEGAVFGAAK